MFVLPWPHQPHARHGRGPRAKECTNTRRYHACGAKSNALALAMQAQVTSIDPTDDRQHLRVAAIWPVHWPRHVLVVAWARVQLRPSRLLCASMGAPATGLQCFDRRFPVRLLEETHWLCGPSCSRRTWRHWSTELRSHMHQASSLGAKPCFNGAGDGSFSVHWLISDTVGDTTCARHPLALKCPKGCRAGHVLKVHVAAHWPSSHGQLCLNSHLCLMSRRGHEQSPTVQRSSVVKGLHFVPESSMGSSTRAALRSSDLHGVYEFSACRVCSRC